MPRIAAALTVLATAAFSIGFNIVRYPVVWDQLAAIERLSQPEDSAESEAPLSESSAGADTGPCDADAWDDRPGDENRVVASISGGSGYDESDGSWDDATDDPHYGDEYSYSSDDSSGGDPYGSESGYEDSEAERTAAVRRLPSVDVWERNPRASEQPRSGRRSRPYPSTGV